MGLSFSSCLGAASTLGSKQSMGGGASSEQIIHAEAGQPVVAPTSLECTTEKYASDLFPPSGCSPYDCSSSCTASKIAGTFAPYDKHIFICESSHAASWGPRVEQASAIISSILQTLEPIRVSSQSSVRLNWTASVLVSFIPSEENITALAEYLYTAKQPSVEGIMIQKIPFEKMFFVCCHTNRDKRCGRAGPQIIAAMRERLEQLASPATKVAVVPCSHIGGHKFAGTLIVYPEADWYGYISKVNAVELLDRVLAGRRLDSCWRGRQQMLEW